jgi:K+-transporting ATPase ATPase C chain
MVSPILTALRPALVALLSLTLITGVAYPLAVTGLADLIAPQAAQGSLIVRDGRVVGSRLLGQAFAGPAYLHGRPSAAGDGYDPTQSGGTNLGPLDPKLADKTKAAARALGVPPASIPADAVTASASGLDPDISPAFAHLQAANVARARGVSEETVQALIARHVETPLFGLIGEPRVNVLAVNLDLDQRFGRRR